jgi:hypothetical protein
VVFEEIVIKDPRGLGRTGNKGGSLLEPDAPFFVPQEQDLVGIILAGSLDNQRVTKNVAPFFSAPLTTGVTADLKSPIYFRCFRSYRTLHDDR